MEDCLDDLFGDQGRHCPRDIEGRQQAQQDVRRQVGPFEKSHAAGASAQYQAAQRVAAFLLRLGPNPTAMFAPFVWECPVCSPF